MGAWQEEKDKLDRKKLLIFAERKGWGGKPEEKTWAERIKGFPYILPGGKDPDIESGYAKRTEGAFVPQAEWWIDQHGGDYDAKIVDYRGKKQLKQELEELYTSGYFDNGDNMDAIIMGHADSQGMYGGVLPRDLGKVLDEFQIDDKFNDVILGSCGMGSNPIACMNVSAAFDGANIYAQGDPNVPAHMMETWIDEDTGAKEADIVTNWSNYPQWGSGSIDPNKISDPNVPLAERVLTKNAPISKYSFDPESEESLESYRLMKRKVDEIYERNNALYDKLEEEYYQYYPDENIY
jgi:hypothetical protein